MFDVIAELKKQVTIIYISHKLEEIMQIGDVITILSSFCEELINKIDIPWITEKKYGRHEKFLKLSIQKKLKQGQNN